MKPAAPLRRNYHGEDATMRQHLRTMHQHFVEDQARFAGFNPDFAAPFAQDWLAALDAADRATPGSVRVGQLMEDTADVQAVLAQARVALQRVFHYAGQAFADKPGHLAQYGRRAYGAARRHPDRMQTLLTTAFAAATRDKKELAAKGYKAAQLAALGALAPQLVGANAAQATRKGTNLEEGDAYVALQNAAYAYGQAVNGAAGQLFATNAARLGLFRLVGHRRRRPGEHRTVTVRPGRQKTLVLAASLLPDTRLRLRLVASQPGQAAALGRVVAAADALGAALPVVLAHATPALDVAAPALGPAGQVLVVQNTGTGPVRVAVGV